MDDQISLHLNIKMALQMGRKIPRSDSKPKRCEEGGTPQLISRWLEKGHSVLQRQLESVHIMYSPWGLVFVEGAKKEW